MARRAMRNRQFIGYTLGPLERNVRGLLFDSGGGGCKILFGQINYFRHGPGREIYFHMAWARENLFSCKHMVNHSPLRQLITRTVMLLKAVVDL